MKVLVDTNILLDVLQHRQPHYAYSAQVWSLAERKQVEAFVSAISFNNSVYVLEKQIGLSKALDAVRRIRRDFQTVPLNDPVIGDAFRLTRTDFEDAIQAASAKLVGADCVVTRNPPDFASFGLRVLRPEELIIFIAP